MSLESDYNSIAQDMTNLLKNEIVRLGLVKSGKLLNSIKFTSRKTATGFKLTLNAEDYFEYLDNEYHILDNMFRSPEYDVIQDRLVTIIANSFLGDL